jgi:hypothetical protein
MPVSGISRFLKSGVVTAWMLNPPIVQTPSALPSRNLFIPTSGQNIQTLSGQFRGGLGKAHQLFGESLNPILGELNRTLVA